MAGTLSLWAKYREQWTACCLYNLDRPPLFYLISSSRYPHNNLTPAKPPHTLANGRFYTLRWTSQFFWHPTNTPSRIAIPTDGRYTSGPRAIRIRYHQCILRDSIIAVIILLLLELISRFWSIIVQRNPTTIFVPDKPLNFYLRYFIPVSYLSSQLFNPI